jgi:hypothetical protein
MISVYAAFERITIWRRIFVSFNVLQLNRCEYEARPSLVVSCVNEHAFFS